MNTLAPPFLLPLHLYACVDELMQQQGSYSALHRVRGVRTAVGWGCRGNRLLAANGGGHRSAAESNHRRQDGTALWPLEGVLHSRYTSISIQLIMHDHFFVHCVEILHA